MRQQPILDYQQPYRPPLRRGFAHPRAGSVTAWLIFLNVAIYVIDRLLVSWHIGYLVGFGEGTHIAWQARPMGPLEYWGYFSVTSAIGWMQFWRFVTFQFLHANFDHLLFNMVALFFFGPMVEKVLSSRQFVPFYLLCGVGGAVMYVLLMFIGWMVQSPWVPVIGAPWIPLVGASAGIFGILIAASRIAPNAIALVFGIFPMRLRALAWLFIAYAVFQILFRGSNAGGEAAHLGGAAVGYFLMKFPQVLERIAWFGKRAPPF
jgi:membrane associated rhomboid family serine protease